MTLLSTLKRFGLFLSIFTLSSAHADFYYFCHTDGIPARGQEHDGYLATECSGMPWRFGSSQHTRAQTTCRSTFNTTFRNNNDSIVKMNHYASQTLCRNARERYLNGLARSGDYRLDFVVRPSHLIDNGGPRYPRPIHFWSGNTRHHEEPQWVKYDDGEFFCGFVGAGITLQTQPTAPGRNYETQFLMRLGTSSTETYVFSRTDRPDGVFQVNRPFRFPGNQREQVHFLRRLPTYQYHPEKFELLNARGSVVYTFSLYYSWGVNGPLEARSFCRL